MDNKLKINQTVKIVGERMKRNDVGEPFSYRPELKGRIGRVVSLMIGGAWVVFDNKTSGGFEAEYLQVVRG